MIQQSDIGDDAVLKATGRSWSEWQALLASSLVAQGTHDELLDFLREKHGVPAWWQRAIAASYEQSIGRAPRRERADGFEVEVSRALDLPAELVFQAWADSQVRAKWLRHGDFEPGTVQAPDTVCGRWTPNGSWVDVAVAATGDGKCELAVVHRKLADEAAAEKMRAFWMNSIERLVERVGNNS